jgi:hypothetical protein
MVDIGAIAGTVSALKGVSDIAKAMINLRDAQAVQTKVIELNNQILAAQDSAFAVHEEGAALVARIGELEKEVARLKDWEADKKRYQLANIGRGVVALALKESMSNGEPTHYLCADCAANGKKAYLQPHVSGPYYDKFKCGGCGFEIGIDKGTPPSREADPPEPYF